MSDVLKERARIQAAVDGRTLVDALADTVRAHGDRPAYSDRHGAPEGQSWRTLTWHETRAAESEELTPTLKLKRRIVTTKYSDVVDRLYS